MKEDLLKKELVKKKRAILNFSLTEKGRSEVEEYVTKIWNDNKLTRAHIEAIACELLLKE